VQAMRVGDMPAAAQAYFAMSAHDASHALDPAEALTPRQWLAASISRALSAQGVTACPAPTAPAPATGADCARRVS